MACRYPIQLEQSPRCFYFATEVHVKVLNRQIFIDLFLPMFENRSNKICLLYTEKRQTFLEQFRTETLKCIEIRFLYIN